MFAAFTFIAFATAYWGSQMSWQSIPVIADPHGFEASVRYNQIN